MTKRFTKLTLMILTAMMIFFMSGFDGDRDHSFFDILQKKLSQYNRYFYNERAYLVTDRFVYRPGEDIWFQGYVSSLIMPRSDSGSADFYVKFLNSQGEEIVSRRYPLDEYRVSGRFLVPRTLIPGKYYLVAYTGWMKNQSPEEAFRKEILVGKYFDKRFRVDILYDKLFYYAEDSMNASIRLVDPSGKPVVAAEFDYAVGSFSKTLLKGSGKTDDKGLYRLKCKIPSTGDIVLLTIDLRSRKISGEYSLVIPATCSVPEVTFHPEGGNVVEGIPNDMAFTSRDHYGMPVRIEGDILDSDGHVLQVTSSDNRGMGIFTYQPPKDSCFLRITRPAGMTRTYPLPFYRESGCILHLMKINADTAWFTMRSSGDVSDSILYCVAVINRRIVWKKKLGIIDNTGVKIPITGLPPGIMQVTVFNDRKETVSERLVNITGEKGIVRAKTDRQIYHNRQRVVLSVDYMGKSSKVDLATAVSLRQLALSPLSRNFGEIISAFPYDSLWRSPVPGANLSDLDLLVSGYQPVDWPDILRGNSRLRAYTRKDGLGGIIMDKKEVAAQHAKVRVTHIPNYRFYETQTNENGSFQVMFGSDIVDFNYLNVEAYDARGKVNLFASIDQKYSVDLRKSIELKEENRDRQKIINTLSYDDPNVVYSLRYGPRKFRKSENEPGRRYDPKLYADYTSVLDIIQEMKPIQIKNHTIVFPDTALSSYVQEGVIIVINGVLKGTRVEQLENLLPSDVTNINISESSADIHRYTVVNLQGVIELTTIQGMYRYRQPTVQLGMDILNTSREFYSPDYSIESPTNSDNRKTLYWNPRVSVNRGQSAMISFYTSDIRGTFYGVVEGMDAEGNPVRDEFTFIVE
jgi:hypothetical protein